MSTVDSIIRNKKVTLFLAIGLTAVFSTSAMAEEYEVQLTKNRTIHTVQVVSSWCGNLALSTKVGKLDPQTKICHYEKETPARPSDTCGPHYLNGGILELKVGRGYTCAATHVRSSVTGQEGLDEFKLVLNTAGQYVGSNPPTGEAVLK
jgi:hypothetical protein